jgi:hypothetical protein
VRAIVESQRDLLAQSITLIENLRMAPLCGLIEALQIRVNDAHLSVSQFYDIC